MNGSIFQRVCLAGANLPDGQDQEPGASFDRAGGGLGRRVARLLHDTGSNRAIRT